MYFTVNDSESTELIRLLMFLKLGISKLRFLQKTSHHCEFGLRHLCTITRRWKDRDLEVKDDK